MPIPNVGAVVDGYRFKGGNPNDQKNWEIAPVAVPKPGTVSDGYVFKGGNPNDQKNWNPVETTPAPEKQKQKFAPSPIEEVPIIGGALSGIADIPLGIATGVATIGKTFTDLFGADNAVSDAVEDFGKGADELRSAEAREDSAKDAEEMANAEGFFEGAGAAGKAFLRHPLDVTANLLGTAAPAAIAAAGALLAAPASAATAAVAAAGVGLASGIGMIKGDIYDATLARAKQSGLSNAQAEKIAEEAQNYGGENTDMIALGGVIGAAASATGAGPLLGKMIAGKVLKDVTAKITARTAAAAAAARATGADVAVEAVETGGKGLIRRGVEGALVEGIPEGIQAGQEALAENLAQTRAGFPTDPMKGVLSRAGYEGTLGGILGGGLNVMSGRGEVTDKRQEQIDDEERRAIEIEAVSGGVGKAYEEAVARYKSEGVSDREANLKAGEDIRAYMAERRNINDTTDAGGTESSVPSGAGAAPSDMAGSAGETDRGPVGTGGPTVGPDIGSEGSQQRTLDEAKQILANKKIKLTERVEVAKQLLNDTILNNQYININDIDGKQYDNAKKQLANGKYDGDPVAALEAVTGKSFTAPASAPAPTTVPAGPTPADMAKAPVADAIKAATQPNPASVIPGIAEAAAQDLGIAPAPVVAPPVAPTPAVEPAPAPAAAQPLVEEPVAAEAAPTVADITPEDVAVEPAPVAEEAVAEEPALAPYRPDRREPAVVWDNFEKAFAGQRFPDVSWALGSDWGMGTSTPDPASYRRVAEERMVRLYGPKPEVQAAPEVAPVQEPVQGYVDTRRQELAAQEAADAEAEANLRQEIEARKQREAVQPAPVEAAPEETPEEKAEALRVDIEDAFKGVPELGVKPSISQAAYNTLMLRFKSKTFTTEQIEKEFNDAVRRYEEKNSYQASRSGKAAIGMAVEDLVAHIKDLTKNWRAKIGIKVIGTIDELPATLRKAVERDGMESVPAFVAPDGTIYFIANNIDTMEEASSAVYHESLGHLGLRALFDTRLDAVLAQIYKSNKKLREQADQWTYDNPGVYASDRNPSLRALEEVLAEQSEAGRVDASVWAKISAVIKDFGRRIGLKLDYSDAEVRSILAMAHDQVIDGNSESTVIKGLRYMVNGWHGSPHDFDQFSSGKIGSGEGHTAFGWGLYFGSSRAVGEHYRNQEAGKRITIDGQSMAKGKGRRFIEYGGDFTPSERRALQFLRDSGTLDNTLERLRRRGSKFYTAEEQAIANDMAATLNKLRDEGRLQTVDGKLYEVQLTPSEDEYLDWKEPISNQSAKVQEALTSLGFVSDDGRYPLTGADVYNQLRRKLGSKKEASLALLEAGIRGNRYPDAISRSREATSFNYVIFDDSDVEIVNKYMAGKAKKKTETATVQRLRRKLSTSHYAADMSAAAGDMFFQTRSGKGQIDLLDSAWKAMKNKSRRFVIGYLYYSRDLIRAISKLSPPVARKLSLVNELLHRMDGFRNIGLKTLTYNTLRYSKFNAKFKEGGILLSDLINGSTLASVDPRHASLAAATAADIKLAGLVKEGASKTRIDNRKALIKEVYDMYEKLGTAEMGNGEGQSIYKMVMGGFERSFDNEYKAIVANLRQSGLPADRIQQAVKQITDMYATAKQNAPYAPLFRTGQFWLRVGKGKNRRVFRFESETLYQQGMKDAVKWLQSSGDTRSAEEIKADDKVFNFGRDVDGLEADFMRTEPSDVLKNVFQEIDKGGMADGAAIKDMIFQLYAASLPKGTLYEKMQHREGVEGFSADTLRAYIDAQMATINRLTHLKYASKIRQSIGEAYGLMSGNPNREQLQPYIDEMAIRVAETFSPDISKLDPLARLANKATFFYLLTSIKSALVQFLQLPTVAMPALGARYGTVQAAAVAARYIATIGNKFGTSKVDEDGNIVTNWGQPTMGDSKYVNENKDPEMREALKFAFADARERGILDTTFAGDMVSRKSGPSANYQGRPAKISKWVFDFMSGGIHHSERIAREIAYMSAFELDYAMRRKGGMDHQTAMGVAADTAADLTLETMFDFSESSKPRAMKGPIGRVALQFYSFPIQIASMLTRTFLGTVSLLPNPERKVAAKQFFGIIGMTWMFAGTTGMPGYSFMMGLMTSLLAAAGLADDDDDEKGNNALTSRNLDLWFREKFLPEYFGPDSDLANDLGLDKEQAQDLTRAVKMGPISAATNLNLGSSVGLDGLFFRDDTPVDTNEEALRSLWYTLSLGATGSVLRNFLRGGDYMMKGEWQRAAENLTPAPVRNALVAKRLASEGYITPSTQDVVAPVEEYTWGKLVGQGIGFGRTDISDIQKSNLLAKKTVDKIEKERADYINKLDKAYRDITLKRTNMKDGQEAINKVWKDIFKWNDNTDFISPIFLGNWQDSIGTRAEDRARSMQGLRVSKNYDPYVRGLLEKNR